MPNTDPATTQRAQIARIHAAACQRKDESYMDPASGLLVMTAHALQTRGFCCGVGCRHCPYGPEEQEAAGRPPQAEVWSNGEEDE